MPFLPPNQQRQSTKGMERRQVLVHRHRIDKYLDTLLANRTAQNALPPTTAKSPNRKMAGLPQL